MINSPINPLQIYYGHSVQWDSKNGNYFVSQGHRGLRGEVSKGREYKGGDKDVGMERGRGWIVGWRDREEESSSGLLERLCSAVSSGVQA